MQILILTSVMVLALSNLQSPSPLYAPIWDLNSRRHLFCFGYNSAFHNTKQDEMVSAGHLNEESLWR